MALARAGLQVQPRPSLDAWGVERSRWVAAPGTLLGPEGSGESSPSWTGTPAWTLPRGRTAPHTPLEYQSCMRRRRHCREGDRPYVENYTVDASILNLCSQVFKGTRWMPWHQEPKKDVGICDKPRGVDNQTVIRGFPNGETRLEASPVTLA